MVFDGEKTSSEHPFTRGGFMSRIYANEPFEQLREASEVMAALGSVTRQRILMLFEGQGKLNIKDIADRFNLSRTAVVHHIGVLQDAGILKGERVGKEMVLDVDWAMIAEALTKMLDYVSPLVDQDTN
jgi:Predicted transcriptional regulator